LRFSWFGKATVIRDPRLGDCDGQTVIENQSAEDAQGRLRPIVVRSCKINKWNNVQPPDAKTEFLNKFIKKNLFQFKVQRG